MNKYKPLKSNVKYLGRAYEYKENVVLGFSASGIAFSMGRGKVEIDLIGDSTVGDANKLEERARVAFYINGKKQVDVMVDDAKKTYVFELDNDYNEITVIKLTENAMSSVAISEIRADEIIKPIVCKEKFIEFIGDSITCGYGVDDENEEHSFRTETEDCSRAYAMEAAGLLDMDFSLVSLSGYGIISGYSDDGETRRPDQLIPSYYEKCGFSYASILGHQPQDLFWDFSAIKPDLIVINLGTNDASYCKEYEDRKEWFVKDYVCFLKRVRELNSNSVILCCLGIMGEALCPYVEKAVSIYKSETNDENIFTEMFREQLREDGLVADSHPSSVTHKKAAKQISERIKQLLM